MNKYHKMYASLTKEASKHYERTGKSIFNSLSFRYRRGDLKGTTRGLAYTELKNFKLWLKHDNH